MTASTTRAKLVYLFYYAAAAALMPVLALYYQSVGMRGTQIGLLTALAPIGSIMGAAFWGARADATGRHKRTLIVTVAGAAAVSQFFLVAATFEALIPVAFLFAFVQAAIMPLVDNTVLTILDERRALYGRVRLWGAIGWGISGPLVGVLVDARGLATVFPVYGALMALTLASAVALPVAGSESGTDVRAGLRVMVRDARWILFLMMALVAGTGGAIVHYYLFIYISDLGGGGTIRGVALAVATVSELTIFWFADRLIRRFGSRRIVLVTLMATAFRLLLYALVSTPEAALIPQLLHGVGFALFLVAGVTYARELAPPGMGATAQAVFSGTSMGLGGVIGALSGGLLYEVVGVRRMYVIASAAMVGAVIVLVVASKVHRRRGSE